MKDKLKSLSYDQLAELAKANKRLHLFNALVYKEEKKINEIALELGLVKEYEKNKLEFKKIVRTDTRNAAKLITDFNSFLLVHICFPEGLNNSNQDSI